MYRFRALYKRFREPIMYMVFGALTTAVNYLVYLPLYNSANFSASFSNIAAWFAATSVAFITNKMFVFQSRSWRLHVMIPEALKFFGCRLGTGTLETLLLLFTVDVMHMNGNIWKIILSFLVIALNYLASKAFIFHEK